MSSILNEEPGSPSHIAPSISLALQKVLERCLEKNPEQRFHSASDLAFVLDALSDSGSAPNSGLITAQSKGHWPWIAISGAAIATTVVVSSVRPSTPSAPVVESVVQLTNDGRVKAGGIETEGSRVYFNEGPSGSFRIAQVSVHGGETGEIPTDLLNPQIAGLT